MQRDLFDWISNSENLEFRTWEDWYNVKYLDIEPAVSSLLHLHYDGSLVKALQALYPEKNWQVWKFLHVPHEFWNDIENQRIFLNWLSKELLIENLDDWYKVNPSKIIENGGTGLLKCYGDSFSKALQAIYPNVAKKTSIQSAHFEKMGEELGVKKMEDVLFSSSQTYEKGGRWLLSQYSGSLPKALMSVFPNYNWELWKFQTCQLNTGKTKLIRDNSLND